MAWSLKYEDLTTAEAQAISGVFTASQGQFGYFTFIDPLANLMGGARISRRPAGNWAR